MSEYDSHEWGDGMPHGNKSAGYVGLMIAKAQGKTRHDYNPKQRKKQIGKLDVNKMRNPSDYIKLAQIDKYKDYHTGHPKKTWEQVKAEASDVKHAVATWARLHPNKDERAIARETGVSQPSVNRWKRLTGAGKDDVLTKEEMDLWESLRDSYDPREVARIVKTFTEMVSKYVFDDAEEAQGVSAGNDKEVHKLYELLTDWLANFRHLRKEMTKDATEYMKERTSLTAIAQERGDSDYTPSERASDAIKQLTEARREDPTNNKDKLSDEYWNSFKTLESLEMTWDSTKVAIFQSVMLIKQISKTLMKIMKHLNSDDPSDRPKLRSDEDLPHPEEMESDKHESGHNYIEDENDSDPTGAGKRGAGFFDGLKAFKRDMGNIYNAGKDVVNATIPIVKGYNELSKFKRAVTGSGYVKDVNGITSGNLMPNRIIRYAQKYEAKPVRGGGITSGNLMPNRIIRYAQKYEAKPVRGGGIKEWIDTHQLNKEPQYTFFSGGSLQHEAKAKASIARYVNEHPNVDISKFAVPKSVGGKLRGGASPNQRIVDALVRNNAQTFNDIMAVTQWATLAQRHAMDEIVQNGSGNEFETIAGAMFHFNPAMVPQMLRWFQREADTDVESEGHHDSDVGGSKAKKLYTKDGKLYNGLWHQMSDGNYHTGKTHGKRSKALFIK